jgi:CHAD domain-containing protein
MSPANRHGAAARRTEATLTADRLWSEAAEATLDDLAAEVRRQANAIEKRVDEDAVHDMRTATRRLRTAITI